MSENVTRIPLRNMRREVVAYALVDAEDVPLVSQFRSWHRTAKGYASHAITGGGTVRMHRLILGLSAGDERQGDHINGNRLDNRRSNLRIATAHLNSQNVRTTTGTSRFRGVSWSKYHQRWIAYAKAGLKRTHLGYFDDELEAARVAREFRLAHMPGAVD